MGAKNPIVLRFVARTCYLNIGNVRDRLGDQHGFQVKMDALELQQRIDVLQTTPFEKAVPRANPQ